MSKRLVLGIPIEQYILEAAAYYADNCRKAKNNGYIPLDWNWLKAEFWERELRRKGTLTP